MKNRKNVIDTLIRAIIFYKILITQKSIAFENENLKQEEINNLDFIEDFFWGLK